MPLAQDIGIWFDLPSGDKHHPLMRDHAIGIYPETSKSIIENVFQDPAGG